jgi:hypothetical protein
MTLFLIEMDYITNAFHYVLGFQSKKEVTGYVMAEDAERHRTLLMIKEGERCWKTSWYDTNEYTIAPITDSMSSIFANIEVAI